MYHNHQLSMLNVACHLHVQMYTYVFVACTVYMYIAHVVLLYNAVLDRAQSFLPQLREANQELRQRLQSQTQGDIDIESVEEGEACIEMVSILIGIDGAFWNGSPVSNNGISCL